MAQVVQVWQELMVEGNDENVRVNVGSGVGEKPEEGRHVQIVKDIAWQAQEFRF